MQQGDTYFDSFFTIVRIKLYSGLDHRAYRCTEYSFRYQRGRSTHVASSLCVSELCSYTTYACIIQSTNIRVVCNFLLFHNLFLSLVLLRFATFSYYRPLQFCVFYEKCRWLLIRCICHAGYNIDTAYSHTVSHNIIIF